MRNHPLLTFARTTEPPAQPADRAVLALADPALLDRLPRVPGLLCHAPAELQ